MYVTYGGGGGRGVRRDDGAGEPVDAQLDAVFGVTQEQYREAHAWWMSALEGAEDRLDDLERQVQVFAARYGGTG